MEYNSSFLWDIIINWAYQQQSNIKKCLVVCILSMQGIVDFKIQEHFCPRYSAFTPHWSRGLLCVQIQSVYFKLISIYIRIFVFSPALCPAHLATYLTGTSRLSNSRPNWANQWPIDPGRCCSVCEALKPSDQGKSEQADRETGDGLAGRCNSGEVSLFFRLEPRLPEAETAP